MIRDLPGAIDLAGVGALAFTSANGVEAFARRCPQRNLPVFAVGAASAAAAGAAGFSDIAASDAGVEALARLILANPRGGMVLHPGAADLAGDLVGQLQSAGQAARRVAIYATAPAAPPAELLDSLDTLDGVTLHSPRAARVLAGLLADRRVTRLIAYCLSQPVADALIGLQIGQTRVAALPNEDALLSLISTRREP